LVAAKAAAAYSHRFKPVVKSKQTVSRERGGRIIPLRPYQNKCTHNLFPYPVFTIPIFFIALTEACPQILSFPSIDKLLKQQANLILK